MENLNKSIEELISIIINSKEYQTCLQLKEQMSKNEELLEQINNVKNLQKKYIKSNYNEEVKQNLEEEEEKLKQIPIYVIYNENLEIVNRMINTINEELNQYFYDKLNSEIEF